MKINITSEVFKYLAFCPVIAIQLEAHRNHFLLNMKVFAYIYITGVTEDVKR